MNNPAIFEGQAQNSSLADSNGEANVIVDQLCDFLEIEDLSKQYVRVLLTLFTARADEIVGEFYRKVQTSAVGSYVTDDAIEQLIPKQKAHWEKLFNSDFSRDYIQSVRRIGIRHHDIALNPSWYIAGYAKLKIEVMKQIAAADAPPEKKNDLVTTLEKYVAMDMAFSLASFAAVVLD